MSPGNVAKSFAAKKQVLKARLLSYRLLRCSTERRARGCRMLVHAVTIFEASRMSFFRADYWQMYSPDYADGEQRIGNTDDVSHTVGLEAIPFLTGPELWRRQHGLN